MRIIFLNTSHGEIRDGLFGFISEYADNTDIFCFLEVTSQMFQEFSEILNNFNGEYVANTPRSGQSIFVNKNISVVSHSKVSLYEQVNDDSGSLQKMKI